MRAVIHRCKHCNKIYTYYASGENCHDPYNSRDYCPECQKAIMDALSVIPKHSEGRYQQIDIAEHSELVKRLESIKTAQDERMKDSPGLLGVQVITYGETKLPFDTIEVYRCDDRKYAIGYRNDEKILFQFSEYVIEEKTFTGPYLDYEHYPDSYHRDYNFNTVPAKDIEPIKISPPNGRLFYMDVIGH